MDVETDQDAGREELAEIRSLMAESQGLLTGSWRHQLVWGLLTAFAVLGIWVANRLEWLPAPVWILVVAIVLGWMYSLLFAQRRDPVGNVAARAFGGIWLGLGVTLTLIFVVPTLTGAVARESLPGLMAFVFGAGYFSSGFLSGLRWLSAVGFAWWVSGVALLVWRGVDSLLALGVLLVALQVLPALKLRSMERSHGQSR